MAELRSATQGDLAGISALLQLNKLPVAGVAEHLDTFIIACSEAQTVACAGLEVYQGAGLLRSVSVHPDYQNQGLGQQLTQAVLELARKQGLAKIALLTTTAGDYFKGLGFQPVSRQELPASLQASAELQGACPDSALALILHL